MSCYNLQRDAGQNQAHGPIIENFHSTTSYTGAGRRMTFTATLYFNHAQTSKSYKQKVTLQANSQEAALKAFYILGKQMEIANNNQLNQQLEDFSINLTGSQPQLQWTYSENPQQRIVTPIDGTTLTHLQEVFAAQREQGHDYETSIEDLIQHLPDQLVERYEQLRRKAQQLHPTDELEQLVQAKQVAPKGEESFKDLLGARKKTKLNDPQTVLGKIMSFGMSQPITIQDISERIDRELANIQQVTRSVMPSDREAVEAYAKELRQCEQMCNQISAEINYLAQPSRSQPAIS